MNSGITKTTNFRRKNGNY